MLQILKQKSNTSPTLLAGLARQDAFAWEQFVTRYSPAIHGWVRSKGVSESDACDVVQNVMLKLFDSLGNSQYSAEKGRFRAWLKTVVTNAALDWFRRGNRYREVLADLEVQADENSLEQAIESEYQKELFEHALELVEIQVQPKSWAAFERTALLHETPADVAQQMGITLAHVYVLKNRVLSRMRTIVDELAKLDDRLM
ncbi:MAG: hypothetical protein Aurels2KO_29680 [Aureliella sp.]